MLRFLGEKCSIDATAEHILAICILENIPLAQVASADLQEHLKQILTALEQLDPILQRELAISSLEELLT